MTFFYYPYPTISVDANVFGNATVPLNIYGGPLPHGYYTLWYESIDFEVPDTDSEYPVTLAIVSGETACDPLRNHTKIIQSSSNNKTIYANTPADFETYHFLTNRSKLTANITVDSSIAGNTTSTETIKVCILSEWMVYKEFKNESDRDLKKCQDIELYTYNISNGAVYSFNHTFHQSSYYFITLLATTELTVRYFFQIEYQFYDLGDYFIKDENSCEIKRFPRECPTLYLHDRYYCFFVKAETGDDRRQTDMKVTLNHKGLNNIGTISLGVALGGLHLIAILFKFTELIVVNVCIAGKCCCFKKNN